MNPANVYIFLLVIYATIILVVDFQVKQKDDETIFEALYYTGAFATIVGVLKMVVT